MAGRPSKRLAVVVFLVLAALQFPTRAAAQDVKLTYDKSTNFQNYKKYAWGANYLLTHQRPEDQASINTAIVDSMNRDLRSRGFVLDRTSPDFIIIYEVGGTAKADTSAGMNVYALDTNDMEDGDWTNLGGMSSAVWTYTLAKVRITVTDAATRRQVWQAIASEKIRNTQDFMFDLKQSVDKFVQKTMKDFPPKK